MAKKPYEEEYVFPNNGKAIISVGIGLHKRGYVIYKDDNVALEICQSPNIRALRSALEGFLWGLSMHDEVLPSGTSREEGWSAKYYQGMTKTRPSAKSVEIFLNPESD